MFALLMILVFVIMAIPHPIEAQGDRDYLQYKAVMAVLYNLGDGEVYQDAHLRIERELITIAPTPSPGPSKVEHTRVYWNGRLVAHYEWTVPVELHKGRWVQYVKKLARAI